jgi:NAD(P)-dependent dehydrogenase (short-subunit alcohol dehydrogenase family)
MARVAVVTGGTRGIGFGIARALGREGYALAVCGRRTYEEVKQALRSLLDLGCDVHYCQSDVGRTEDRARLVESVRERFGRLDILVNNAGVAPLERRDILEATEESFDHVLGVNLKGPYFLTQAVAAWMIAQKRDDAAWNGCVVNVSSVSATMLSLNRGEYCVAKAGLAMASALWAARLAEFDIPVYEVRPGIVSTDMTSGAKEKYDRLIGEGLVPQRRWGEPEDVGKAVAMLVRGELGFSTGQVVMVDGGLSLQRL